MNQNNGAQIALAAMGLLTLGTGIAAQAQAGQQMEVLNAASLTSMQSSWIKFPIHCKARGFNADAAPIASKVLRAEVQNVYASFGV